MQRPPMPYGASGAAARARAEAARATRRAPLRAVPGAAVALTTATLVGAWVFAPALSSQHSPTPALADAPVERDLDHASRSGERASSRAITTDVPWAMHDDAAWIEQIAQAERQRLEAERAAAEAAARAAAEAAAAEQIQAEQAAAEQARAQQAAAQSQRGGSRTALSAPAASGSATLSDVKTYASSLVGGGQQFTCLDKLWQKESRWDHTADNPTSSAYGIPQALPGKKMASAGADWRTNPYTQVRWGVSYIEERYGTACDAWAHSQARNWY